MTLHYDALWQVEKVYQNALGAVDDDGVGTDSPKVYYTYGTQAVSSGNYHHRDTQVYPDSASVVYTHDGIGRISNVRPGDATYGFDYKYIGLDMPAKLDNIRIDVQLDYSADSAGNRDVAGQYPGYDAFGRIAQQMCVDGNYGTGSGGLRLSLLDDALCVCDDKVGRIIAAASVI